MSDEVSPIDSQQYKEKIASLQRDLEERTKELEITERNLSAKLEASNRKNEELEAKTNNLIDLLAFPDEIQALSKKVKEIWQEKEDNSAWILLLDVEKMFQLTEDEVSREAQLLREKIASIPDEVFESTGKTRKAFEEDLNKFEMAAKDVLDNCMQATKKQKQGVIIEYSGVASLISLSSSVGSYYAGFAGTIIGAALAGLLYFAVQLCKKFIPKIWEIVKPLLSKCWKAIPSGTLPKLSHAALEYLENEASMPAPVRKFIESIVGLIQYINEQSDDTEQPMSHEVQIIKTI